jgi:hypothetical protein
MSPEAEPNVNPLIWAAIEQKRLLRFRYKNRERIVEPYDYGVHNGSIKALWIPSRRLQLAKSCPTGNGHSRS